MPIDDLRQDVDEICQRVDIVERVGLDQGREDSPMFGTTVGSGKRRILAA